MPSPLQVTQTRQADHLLVTLAGVINEEADFAFMASLPPGKVVINTRGVSRMNSCGVREWIQAVAKVPAGCQLVYEECSTAIVDQMNMITNFLGGGTVRSLYIPFVCESCNASQEALCDLGTCLSDDGLQLPEVTCAECKQAMALADDPEELFSFLS